MIHRPANSVPVHRLPHALGLALVAIASTSLCCSATPGADRPADAPIAERAPAKVIRLFQDVHLSWQPEAPARSEPDGVRVLAKGQVAEVVVDVPELPVGQHRFVAVVAAQPRIGADGVLGDPWSRLGSLTMEPTIPPTSGAALPAPIELVRFVTGFGGEGRFEVDVTDLAPAIAGQQRFRLTLETYLDPGWSVSASIVVTPDPSARTPAIAIPAWGPATMTVEQPRVRARVTIPKDTGVPRVRMLSTGHGSAGGDEFVSRTHVLRVDGVEVLRWRPYREAPAGTRARNPWAGRRQFGSREVWSSDTDRSGWVPGWPVEPSIVPVPELSPGTHTLDLQVLGMEPSKEGATPNFWRESMAIVADAVASEASASEETPSDRTR